MAVEEPCRTDTAPRGPAGALALVLGPWSSKFSWKGGGFGLVSLHVAVPFL